MKYPIILRRGGGIDKKSQSFLYTKGNNCVKIITEIKFGKIKMKVIAKKSKTPAFVIGGFLLSGAVLLILGLALNKWVWIIGAAIAAVAFCLIIDYLILPKVYIEASEKEIVIYKKFNYPFHRIKNVSVKKARANGGEFDWGTVTVYTASQTFALRYVENCEGVKGELLELCKH